MEEYPGAIIFDITSSSQFKGGRLLSPFYPHKNIPIPGDSKGLTANSVEGIWQGLKVFENAGIDINSFSNDTMKNIKRTVRKFGKPLGHQYGVYSKELLSYLDAKRLIYAPAYRYVLENIPQIKDIVEKIRKQAEISDIILLDYNVNPDNRDASKPLSHAELVKMYIEGRYPEAEEDFRPWSIEELKAFKKAKKKPTKERRKVSIADLPNYLEETIQLLEKDERTVTDLMKLLSIDIKKSAFENFLNTIPNIQKIIVKKTTCYTLKIENNKSTLF